MAGLCGVVNWRGHDLAPLLAALEFVDEDAVEACYRRHRAGEDHRWALYTLVTLLGMPVTEQVA